MRKRWTYSDAIICNVGDMACTVCRRKITDGPFRYRETDEAYLPQHKSCSPEDPEWAAIVNRQTEAAAYFNRRKAALQAYVNEFGAPYDELIDEVMAARSPIGMAEPQKNAESANTSNKTAIHKPVS